MAGCQRHFHAGGLTLELLDRLNEIFCEVFDDDDIIETRFNIRFNHKELLTFKNVGDLLKCTSTKITN